MKVPEKVYRHQTTGNPRLNGIYYEHKPAKIRYDDKIIEYIRKDAFIEKACEWLKEHVLEYTPELNFGVGKTDPDYYTKHFIEDFKNHMDE